MLTLATAALAGYWWEALQGLIMCWAYLLLARPNEAQHGSEAATHDKRRAGRKVAVFVLIFCVAYLLTSDRERT